MDFDRLAAQMAAQAAAIGTMVGDVSDEQARWKPDPASWSILEVINHLADEEVEDFRTHLDIALHRPNDAWPPIDPEGWVDERRYSQRDLGESVLRFLSAREDSLAWLRGLDSPDWGASYEAPFGPIRAGDIMAAWVAHDLLQTRQLVELQWAYTSRVQVAPFDVAYAGVW